MASSNPARGMRDFLPADVRKRDYVIGIIKAVYESYGFEPLETPAVENIETSFGKNIGEDNTAVVAETVVVVDKILNRLGLKDFTIRLNHHHVLVDILDTVGVPEDFHYAVFAAIHKFDISDLEPFVDELNNIGVSDDATTMLIEMFAETAEILNQEHDINRTIVGNLINIVSNEILFELGQILKSVGKAPVLIDPSLAGVLPNYTGIIIETNISGVDSLLGNGGCSEEMFVRSDDKNPSTCQFSFDLENIIAIMENDEIFPSEIAVSGTAASLR